MKKAWRETALLVFVLALIAGYVIAAANLPATNFSGNVDVDGVCSANTFVGPFSSNTATIGNLYVTGDGSIIGSLFAGGTFVGGVGDTTDYPAAQALFFEADTGDASTAEIGVVAQATGSATTSGIAVKAVVRNGGATEAVAVDAEVPGNAAQLGNAIGFRHISTAVHGGEKYGIWLDVSSGTGDNWSVYAPGGDAYFGMNLYADTIFVGGTAGPIIANNSAVVEFRNNGDSAYASIKPLGIKATEIKGTTFIGTESHGGTNRFWLIPTVADDGARLVIRNNENGGNNSFIFTAFPNLNKNHGRSTLLSDPTMFFFSGGDVDSDDTEWLSITHDQTDGVIATGKGALKLAPTTGHVVFDSTKTAPGLTSCGGGTPSIVGSDSAGNITIGTGATQSCTVTFASAFLVAPACFVNGNNTAVTYIGTQTTTILTITSSADMDSDVVSYICIGG